MVADELVKAPLELTPEPLSVKAFVLVTVKPFKSRTAPDVTTIEPLEGNALASPS